MYLQSIQLINFKNHQESFLAFSPDINCLVGDNGSGKTNLLDAIYYLSMTKSALSTSDTMAVKHNESFFSVIGNFVSETDYKVVCSLKTGEKKQLKVNDNVVIKTSSHIGKFPVVLIAPDDIVIIKEGSEERRRFFDTVMSQIDQDYLEELIRYNRYLKQRNSLLKQFFERNYRDKELLDSYSEPLVRSAMKIYQKRLAFVQNFEPIFSLLYKEITNSKESVSLGYLSSVSNIGFEELFKKQELEDLRLQRTTVGVHTDEYEFLIEGHPLRKIGSQGQQKSYLIALKLAQFEIVKIHNNSKPILLLDDIFDKLDDARIQQLLVMIGQDRFGQLFITDARPERTKLLLKGLKSNIATFEVERGQIKERSK